MALGPVPPEQCPAPSVHSENGGPFRYCPNCTWTETPISDAAAEILRRFDSFNLDGSQQAAMARQRRLFKDRAGDILTSTRPSREQSLALTALEEAKYWTNQAIAVHGSPVPIQEQ